jgi:uncharacterized protein YndB with AHSA1/START domain
MARSVASRTLLAPLEDVWAFLAEPYHLADWWPGISGVQPDRRGLAPGARWQVQGSSALAQGTAPLLGLAMFRRPSASGTLLVLAVERGRRIAFQLVDDRLDAELELESASAAKTRVTLVVEAPLTRLHRSLARQALARLYDLVQTAAE